MKPNFALNITDSAISLLHRTSRGWLEVGSANFDAPDLEEALGYLRSSALGLSPHGITTKLILPASQVLYTEVEAPGPDKAAREAQIRTALENRTPYAVDDLVFDWWGTGPTVKVAVVARETLDEAESFAETHRFNPVSFVTTPAEGQFAGEPWFGVTKLSASVLPAGEKVSRDQDPVKVVARDTAKPDAGTKAAVATAEAQAEADLKREAELAREQELALEAEKAAQTAKAEAQRAAQQQAAEEKAAAEKAEADAQKQAEAAADAEALRKTEAAKAEMELRAQELAQAEAKRMVEEAEKAKLAQIEREKTKAALIEAERKRADLERVAAEKAAFDGVTSQVIAEAAGRKAAPEAKDADAAPAFSSRRVEAPAPTAAPATAPTLGPASAKPADASLATPNPVSGAMPEATPAAANPAPDGSKPKAPAAPMVTSIAARKGPTVTSAAPAAGAKPLNGTATFATGAKAELPKPKTEAAGVAAAGIAAAKVTAARIPGAGTALARFKSKSQKKDTPAAGQSAGTKSAAKQAAAGNSMGAFGAKMAPQRGKPRFLGLILTLVLLAALAAVAAWSSLYLSRDTGAEEAVMQADATSQTPPAAPADTQAEAEAELPPATDVAATGQPDNQPPAAEMVAGAAPDVAGTDSQAQAEGQASGPQDEIILATTDQAQPNIDPLAAPRPVSRPDTAPTPATLPPPFGTQYEFEPDGTIKATSKGVVMPDGFWLIAAKPPTVPPARPAAISAPVAETAPDTATAATPPPAANPAGVAADPAGASTAGVSRMEGNGPSSDFQVDATVENRRPKNRAAVPALATQDAATPDAAAAPDDDAALAQDSAAVQLTSLRPRERSATVAAAAEEARKTAEAASLAAKAAAEAAAKIAEEQAAQNGALSVALSPRPAARPSDFSGAVTAAIASASREATRQVAAPQAVPEPEEAEEPEVKVAAAPRIPTRANVAQQATFKNAINLSKINLIGVYGTDSKRYALIRSASGRYSKVRVGDKLDGGTVAAITRTEVRYKKGSRMLALAMPTG